MDEHRSNTLQRLLERATSTLSFQGKIRLLPKVAATAMTLILVMTLLFGLVVQRSAWRIRVGYYPSVQLSRELGEGLLRIQRRLQDGVGAKEMGPLDEARATRDTLLVALREARDNPVLDAREVDRLRADVDGYYELARHTSERMIQGELGDSVFQALKAMTAQYGALSNQLARNINRDRAKIEAAFRRADALRRFNTAGVAIVAILCVAMLWALSGFTARTLTVSLTDPLAHAVRVADRLADGDMTVSIPPGAAGEVGQLLGSMGRMVRYLGEMATAAESIAAGDLSKQLRPRSAVDSFGNAFESMSRYLNEMAAVAEAISAGDMTQQVEPRSASDSFGQAFRTMTRSLSQTMHEMRVSADAISAAAGQVAASASGLSQSTIAEAAVVVTATESVGHVSELVGRNAADTVAMEEIAMLGARHAEESGAATRETLQAMDTIATKISVVDQIATQTNLLAINAAIEAARSGEHGRGFAVVADEVGKLATESRTAAREIAVVIRDSHDVAERSGDLLGRLVPAIVKTATLVQQVAGASADQASGLSRVSRAMSDVDQATQRNAAAAQQLAATAAELAAQAGALQAALGRFRVGPLNENGARVEISPPERPVRDLSATLPPGRRKVRRVG